MTFDLQDRSPEPEQEQTPYLKFLDLSVGTIYGNYGTKVTRRHLLVTTKTKDPKAKDLRSGRRARPLPNLLTSHIIPEGKLKILTPASEREKERGAKRRQALQGHVYTPLA